PAGPVVDDTNAHGDVSMDDDGAVDYTPDSGFSGAASFTYTVTDWDDDFEYMATVHLTVDGTAPTKPTETAPSAAVTLDTKLALAWSASSDANGVKNYDAQVRNAPWNAVFGSYATTVSAKNVRSASYTGSRGKTFCFHSRARDNAGNVSGYS